MWLGMTPLHIAAVNGQVYVTNLILKYCPESVNEVTETKMETCLDLAVEGNQIEVVRHLLKDRNLCFKKNRFGMTLLHIAAQKGRVDIINLILKCCSESVTDVTLKTMETCLHLAVKHNQIEVVLHLLNWIIRVRPDFLYVLNFRNYKGKTAVQFSTSTKKFQTYTILLPLDSGCSVDISYDLSYLENMDIGIDRILQEPTAMITQKIKPTDDYSHSRLCNGSWDLAEEKIKQTDDYSHSWLCNGSRDLTKQKIKHTDDYSHSWLCNGSWDLTEEKIRHTDDYNPRGLCKGSWDLTKGKMKLADDYSVRELSNRSWDKTEEKFKRTDDYSKGGLCKGSWDLTKGKIKHTDDYSQRGLSNRSWDLTEEKIKPSNDCSRRGLSNSSRDLTIQIIEDNDDYSHRRLSNRPPDISIVEPSVRLRNVLLLIATLIAAITVQVPFHFLGSISEEEGYKQDSIMLSWLIWCNSMLFIPSVGFIIYLLHEFPLKPWPQAVALVLFCCYMCSLMVILPNVVRVLLCISVPILLVGFCR